MSDFLFLFFACFTVICAAGVVCNRNSVNAAMCLLLCLAGVAGLFVALDAFLLAFLLILVYAGAVVALFLFIVMLLDVQGQAPPVRRKRTAFTGLAAAALLLAGWASIAFRGRASLPSTAGAPPFDASLRIYADLLFTTYLLPVEVMGFLLLIAMLGVIVLSQRPDRLASTGSLAK
jgi:NADH-quinone oxidoreductase subunit J